MSGLYDYRWQQARLRFLRSNPLCAMCAKRNRVTPATVVDHVIPHKEDTDLFWDEGNWQGLCTPCHNGPKAQLERSGKITGCDEHGNSLDPNHHWYK